MDPQRPPRSTRTRGRGAKGARRTQNSSTYSQGATGGPSGVQQSADTVNEHNSIRDPKPRGTSGRPIRLTSNCYGLELPSDGVWHKYDVEIHRGSVTETAESGNGSRPRSNDEISSRTLRRTILVKLFEQQTQTLGKTTPAYDGRKILITNRKFIDDEQHFTVKLNNARNRVEEYKVRLKHTLAINVSSVALFYAGTSTFLDPEVIQAVNIIIDTSFLNRGWLAVDGSYYDPEGKGDSLSGGKEVRSGTYSSAMFGDHQPLLIVDKDHSTFNKSIPLIEYAAEVVDMRPNDLVRNGISAVQLHKLTKEVKGLMVKLEHSAYGRSVKISSVTETPVNRTMFEKDDGSKESVWNYFGKTYADKPLRYPNLQCIEVKRGNQTNFFPMEVCTVERDQPSRRQLNPKQTQYMTKATQMKPHLRMRFSRDTVRMIARAKELVAFGLRLSERPIETVGRTLDGPIIRTGNRTIKANVGSWKLNLFHNPVRIGQWVYVDTCGLSRDFANTVVRMLIQIGSKHGISISNPQGVFNTNPMSTTTAQMLERVKSYHRNTSTPILAVIIVNADNYSEIKRLTETTQQFGGIVTQCLNWMDVQDKLNFNYVANVFLKINAKFGGVNNVVEPVPPRFREHFMVLGADVSHPSPGDFMTPSIAAVVGSLDSGPSNYYSQISVQCTTDNNRIEYIVNLRGLVLKQLKAHVAMNSNRKPKHIYYFRDGVSDGQFEEVRRCEVTAIRQACSDLQADYKPNITVLIAQKRHHLRLFVIDQNDGSRSGNIPPGTYIDRDVVHASNYDLCMYSHEGLIGTSRPTRYQVIHADVPITMNEVTEIIYYLTHNYASATKSISIPAPTYYAHLAAFRAKEHINSDPSLRDHSGVPSDSGRRVIDLARFQAACEVLETTKYKLYYA